MSVSNIEIKKFTIHQVGNFALGEGIKFSETIISHEKIETELNKLISASFTDDVIYHFTIENSLADNLVLNISKDIFNDITNFHRKSLDLARLLYERSTHPSIKKGDFYILYLDGIEWNGIRADAIVLLKTEDKSTFLRVKNTSNSFDVSSEKGISLKKINKGCLILNTNKDNGLHICIANNSKSGNDAHYWMNSYLHVERLNDSYFQTEEFSKLCTSFILEQVQEDKSLTNAEGVKMLHNTKSYMSANTTLSVGEYKTEVLSKIPSFKEEVFDKYKELYEERNKIQFQKQIQTSPEALKKIHKSMNKVIILDDTVRIFINKKYPLIEQGFDDEKDKHYYKIYFDDEKIQ